MAGIVVTGSVEEENELLRDAQKKGAMVFK